jgi:hypothetical protein
MLVVMKETEAKANRRDSLYLMNGNYDIMFATFHELQH